MDNYSNEQLPDEYKIIFSLWKDGFTTLLNAKAVPPNYIIVSPEWATRLLLYDNEATRNAFLITLGHEMTHNENDFPTTGFHGKNKRFIDWVNEVHADFAAAEKMVECDRQKLLESIIYKRSFKKKWDKDDSSHPSWNKREIYAQKYDFNDVLIGQIQEDTECTNHKLVQKVKDFYKDKHIILK